jgi:hypothetical protein
MGEKFIEMTVLDLLTRVRELIRCGNLVAASETFRQASHYMGELNRKERDRN